MAQVFIAQVVLLAIIKHSAQVAFIAQVVLPILSHVKQLAFIVLQALNLIESLIVVVDSMAALVVTLIPTVLGHALLDFTVVLALRLLLNISAPLVCTVLLKLVFH